MVVLPASMWAMIPMLRTLARAAAVSVATVGVSLISWLVDQVLITGGGAGVRRAGEADPSDYQR